MKAKQIVYAQEMHCCGLDEDEATVTLTLHDGGGGDYLVLDASQWAFDSVAEIDKLADAMKKLIALSIAESK